MYVSVIYNKIYIFIAMFDSHKYSNTFILQVKIKFKAVSVKHKDN